jgi:membrane protease YdiL (CAAX protease family)
MENNIGPIKYFKRKNIKAIDMIKLFIYQHAAVYTILLFLIIIEFILNTKGYSMHKGILYKGDKSTINITFWTGVRICTISPFIEEVVFRDLILRFLKKYGVKFAIITQGLIFGILHNNIITIVHTTLFGILYGYIAVKTNSIVVTTILHIMQNSFTVLMGMTILKNVVNVDLAQIPMTIIYLIVAIITLYRSNWKIRVGDEINIDVRKILLKYKSS